MAYRKFKPMRILVGNPLSIEQLNTCAARLCSRKGLGEEETASYLTNMMAVRQDMEILLGVLEKLGDRLKRSKVGLVTSPISGKGFFIKPISGPLKDEYMLSWMPAIKLGGRVTYNFDDVQCFADLDYSLNDALKNFIVDIQAALKTEDIVMTDVVVCLETEE